MVLEIMIASMLNNPDALPQKSINEEVIKALSPKSNVSLNLSEEKFKEICEKPISEIVKEFYDKKFPDETKNINLDAARKLEDFYKSGETGGLGGLYEGKTISINFDTKKNPITAPGAKYPGPRFVLTDLETTYIDAVGDNMIIWNKKPNVYDNGNETSIESKISTSKNINLDAAKQDDSSGGSVPSLSDISNLDAARKLEDFYKSGETGGLDGDYMKEKQ